MRTACPKPSLVIADDDASIRLVLKRSFEDAGYPVLLAEDAAGFERYVSASDGPLLAIADVMLPDGDGLDLVPRLLSLRPGLKVIAISAHSNFLTALRATRCGVFDYIPKPFDLDHIHASVKRAVRAGDRGRQKNRAKPSLPPWPDQNNARAPAHTLPAGAEQHSAPEPSPIGHSQAMQTLWRQVARLSQSNLSILITGESGTGKEIIARTLHRYSNRSQKPFVAVNMAALPRDLVETTLFGHEKGAFTGAVRSASGKFREARGGTLFLDEIGDMPPDAQTRLLRVLQEGEYTVLGGRNETADCRILCATHRNLVNRMAQGLFREDLYYRLNVVSLHVPALRDRKEDIPDLFRCFLDRAVLKQGQSVRRVMTEQALLRLQSRDWPGNVRELENCAERLCALSTSEMIDEDILDEILDTKRETVSAAHSSSAAALDRWIDQVSKAEEGKKSTAGLYRRIVGHTEKRLITHVLQQNRCNQRRSADILGINRNTLRQKIREFGIDLKAVRTGTLTAADAAQCSET